MNDVLENPYICLMGTMIVSGTATAAVVTTGRHTFLSTVASSLSRQPSSLNWVINQVSWVLIRGIAIMVPIVFLVNGLTKGDWKEALLFALAVAVGLTPEMLPVVVTTALAKGAISLTKQQVIVKHLLAIQNLGSMDVLGMDKTGTLTQNSMTLVRHIDATGSESQEVLRLAALNSRYQTGLKNAFDQGIREAMRC